MAIHLNRAGLRRKNVWKVIRTILQFLLLALAALWAIWAIQSQPRPAETGNEPVLVQNRVA